jgi:sugar phosphate isomerase/epimerase
LAKLENRTIGISTGSFWQWEDNPNRDALIKYAAMTNLPAVELTFYDLDDFSNSFILSETSKQYLLTRQFVSIHAPCLKKITGDKKRIQAVFLRLEELYKSINASHIVFHQDSFDDFTVFDECGFNVSIENIEYASGFPFEKFFKIFTEHPNLKMCLDVAHAYSVSRDSTARFADRLGDRISHIHISGSNNSICHIAIKDSPADFMNSLKPIKQTNVPLIIEEDIAPRNYEPVLNEAAIIRNFLNNKGE